MKTLLILSFFFVSQYSQVSLARDSKKRAPSSTEKPAVAAQGPTPVAPAPEVPAPEGPKASPPPSSKMVRDPRPMPHLSSHSQVQPQLHIATNFLDFTQGRSNLLIDFISGTGRVHYHYRSYFSADQEVVKKGGQDLRYTVSRSALGLGLTWYANEISAKRNWTLSPALVFAKTDDALDTAAQAGVGLKGSILFRFSERLTFEGGFNTDSVHSSHRNALYLGLGIFL